MLLPDASVTPESIISINEIPSRLIATEMASPLAIILYELLENALVHAFEKGSPANYLQITLTTQTREGGPGRELKLCVRDSGGGITETTEQLMELSSGLSIVQAITLRLGGDLDISSNSGTQVTVTIPEVSSEQGPTPPPFI